MTDLVSRLLEAIEETERLAREATKSTSGDRHLWATEQGAHPIARHVARNDPSFVLRRCAADREIVELYRSSTQMSYDSDAPHIMLEVIEVLARAYGLSEGNDD